MNIKEKQNQKEIEKRNKNDKKPIENRQHIQNYYFFLNPDFY